MRWSSVGAGFVCTNVKLRRSHFLSLLFITRNNIITIMFDSYHCQSYAYYTSSSPEIENPQPRSLNSLVNSKHRFSVEIIHAQLIKNGSFHHLQVGNYLLSLYVKSQDLSNAQDLFDEIRLRDVRTWTILISGFTRIGSSKMALDLFTEMQKEGFSPNQFTLSTVLKCCSSLDETRMGKGIHGWILRNGIAIDVVLANSILDHYVKCRAALNYAERLFELLSEKDTVSWNIMIGAYLQIGDTEKSLNLFKWLPIKDVASWNIIIDGLMQNGFDEIALNLLYQMVEIGPVLNEVTFSIALALVSSLSALELGKEIHGRVLRIGINNDNFVRNSLIDMYFKCEKMDKASLIFQNSPQNIVRTRNSKIYLGNPMVGSVSWSLMVIGYVQNGRFEDALKIFGTMVREQVELDKFTLTSIISACASCRLLELGRQIHAKILKIGLKPDVFLASSMIDMYAKCGRIDDAWLIFSQANVRNIVLWTSMISSCALHGEGREAVWLFELMISEGITPNEVCFVGVLTACSHAGLVEEGCKYFKLMKEVYSIKPGVEHFTCMVDLYGRAGRLDEIKHFIHKNGISHLSAVWRAFLSSCRIHKNIELARWVSQKLIELEPSEAEPYILLSNTLAISHRFDEAAKLRGLMKERGVKKNPGQSWIQLKNQVHTFIMGDRSHPREAETYSYLDKLIGKLKEIGYSNDLSLVMQDVEEEQKEVILGFHSEKLAIAYGLMNTSCGTPIRVMKNLRICTDCHNFVKYTSRLLGREIIVRDIHRFHHFKHGNCSCGDYW